MAASPDAAPGTQPGVAWTPAGGSVWGAAVPAAPGPAAEDPTALPGGGEASTRAAPGRDPRVSSTPAASASAGDAPLIWALPSALRPRNRSSARASVMPDEASPVNTSGGRGFVARLPGLPSGPCSLGPVHMRLPDVSPGTSGWGLCAREPRGSGWAGVAGTRPLTGAAAQAGRDLLSRQPRSLAPAQGGSRGSREWGAGGAGSGEWGAGGAEVGLSPA